MAEKPTSQFGGITVEECEKMIRRSLQTPTMKFLGEQMEKAGCAVRFSFFKAMHCDERISGAYVPGEGIFVCSNHMKHQTDVNQVLAEKLINAYDNCRAKDLDWSNCAHHACSAIRAMNLSGDCHYKRELLKRGFVKVRGHGQECVKRRAMQAVSNNPNCSETAAKDAVEAVWDICYNDTSPFERAP